ncbi:polyprenyl synthetase family protein [Granulicoccus phenolivorans]|uniref:polyprenyl synthetase family protein n=1 Tax=Granulicoccus phenolivorans TaxID=266854 RepID=UPI000420AC94|nr:polyprenyl synthetase family protein [Granulicoccus phenolivorans]
MVQFLDPAVPVSPALRAAIGAQITDFLARQQPVLEAMGPEMSDLAELAAAFTAGGKRLRPAFAVWGYAAVAGEPDDTAAASLLQAAASLDLLHVSALMHDDVMDASDTRRGMPSAHRQLEARHTARGLLGSGADFGRAGAILLGDLLLVWSMEMLDTAGLSESARARVHPLVHAVRTEVTCGQYLDVLAQHRPRSADAAAALAEVNRVVEYKTAKYSVQRPVQIGAALAAGSAAQQAALAAYGSPLGRAFQFRDDLLGVFGDSAITGKPAGDDLREGKRTVLLAEAYAHLGTAAAARLDELVGNPDLTADGVAEARTIIAESGAEQRVEALIAEAFDTAVAALDAAEFTDLGRAGLIGLAEATVRRAH